MAVGGDDAALVTGQKQLMVAGAQGSYHTAGGQGDRMVASENGRDEDGRPGACDEMADR